MAEWSRLAPPTRLLLQGLGLFLEFSLALSFIRSTFLSHSYTVLALPPTYFSLSILQTCSSNTLLPEPSSSPITPLQLCCHPCCISSPAPDETGLMAEYDTISQEAVPQEAVPQEAVPQEAVPQEAVPQEAVPQEAVPQEAVPQEADAIQDALEVSEPGVAECMDGQEYASEQPPSDREDPVSSSKDERSGSDKRIISRSPSPPPCYDCQDVGCTWPCAHHLHPWEEKLAFWLPDLENMELDNIFRECPGITRAQAEMRVGMKNCQFCRIFFSIGQSACHCRGSAHDDSVPKSGGPVVVA